MVPQPARLPRALRLGGLDGLLFAGLFVLIAASGYVMSEPAPYDGLLLVLMGLALVAGVRLERGFLPFALLTALVVAGDAVGSTQADDAGEAVRHTLITLYLAVSALFFAALIAAAPGRTLRVFVPAQVLAALLAGFAGIAGVLALHPVAAELFTEFGRAKGTFKDPNVMAPFLILPIMFGLDALMRRRLAFAAIWLPVLGVLCLALLLSFSRGAWAHMAVSFAVYMGLLMTTGVARRIRVLIIIALGAAVVLVGIARLASVDDVGGLLEERAALTQSYDTGRFAGQRKALALSAEYPLGLGAGDFAKFHGEDVHNVYLTAFINGGWLGGFAYLALVAATLIVGLNAALRRSPWQGAAIVLFATFAGVAFEGLVVDTHHWRHFYVIAGLIWGLAAATRRHAEDADAR